MRNRVRSFLEGVVVAAILLVLVQTFTEDFAVLAGWQWPARRILLFTSFFFDLFFSVEFLIRLYSSVYRGRGSEYFFRRRGWIDLMASIPLLLLSSGPTMLTLLTGGSAILAMGSVLGVLKVVKAIRIARILRLLRILKVFKQIKYTDSVMAQRHVATITSLTISLFVFVLFFSSLAAGFVGVPTVDEIFTDRNNRSAAAIVAASGVGSGESTEAGDELLLVKRNGKTIFTRYDNSHYRQYFGPTDYQYLHIGEYGFFFDLHSLLMIQSKDNITYFVVIVLLVLLLLVYYSPHFAITVTDPIHIMKRGLEDPSYNFEVRIPEKYRTDDIFLLARLYNERYLPMKDRAQHQEPETSSVIQLDDVKDLLSGKE